MNARIFAVLLFLLPLSAGAQRLSLFTSSMYDDNSFSFYEKRADVYHSIFGALSVDTQSDYTYMQGFYYGAVVLFRTYNERTYHVHTIGAYTQIQLNYRGNSENENENENEDENENENDNENENENENDNENENENENEDEDVVEHEHEHEQGEEGEEEGAEDEKETAVDEEEAAEAEVMEVAEAEVFSDSLVAYLFVVPQVGGRFDQEVWDFYDFQRASTLLRLRMHLWQGVMLRPHYTIQYKRYPNLEQFTHLENLGGLLLNRPLGGGFELFAGVDAGIKSYTETVSDTLWVEDKNSGKGKGGVKEPKAVISQFSTPSATQFVFSAGIAWDVLPKAELALSYMRRTNPTNDARFINEGAIFGTTEDEVFDDHYGYQSNEIRLQLEGALPGGLSTISSLQLFDKFYPRTATDLLGVPLPGAPQRHDRRLHLQLQLMYPLFRAADGTGLSVGLAYAFVRNQSNNAYHDFNVHQAALLLSGDW